jgi:hypothetical protein
MPDNKSIRPYRYIPKKATHQLGAIAFVGLILYIVFMPMGDFSNLISLSPHEAQRRAEASLKRIGASQNDYSIRSIQAERLVGLTELTYLNRFCDLGVVSEIRSLGVPMSLVRVCFMASDSTLSDISIWINPENGSMFTHNNEPTVLAHSDHSVSKAPKKSKPAEKINIDSSSTDSAVLVTDSDSVSALVILPKEEVIRAKEDTFTYGTTPFREKSARLELGRLGVDMANFKVKDVKKFQDYTHIEYSSDRMCAASYIGITCDVYEDGTVVNIRPKLVLPDHWLLLDSGLWGTVRWWIFGVFILFFISVIIRRFFLFLRVAVFGAKAIGVLFSSFFQLNFLVLSMTSYSQQHFKGLACSFIPFFTYLFYGSFCLGSSIPEAWQFTLYAYPAQGRKHRKTALCP